MTKLKVLLIPEMERLFWYMLYTMKSNEKICKNQHLDALEKLMFLMNK